MNDLNRLIPSSDIDVLLFIVGVLAAPDEAIPEPPLLYTKLFVKVLPLTNIPLLLLL